MSSMNESTELVSDDGSIPVDVDPSFTGTSQERTSVDPYDDEEDPYDDGDEDLTGYGDTTNRSHTVDASASYLSGSRGVTPSQTTLSHRGSRRSPGQAPVSSTGDGLSGLSEEYETGYGSPSATMTGSYYGEYSSGYDVGSTSYGYGDSSLRSPRSSSELSSTFASFYYDNEYVVKMRRTLNFFRRPIYFFLFSIAGSGAVGGLFRAVRVLTSCVELPAKVATVVGVAPAPAAGNGSAPAGAPSGYPNIPEWLRDVRASLPPAVEAPVKWTLERHGVPALAALQKTTVTVARRVAEGATRTWRVSGPMIPVGVFLPLFTFGALQIASKVMARHRYGNDSDEFDFFGSVSNYNEDRASPSEVTPDSRVRSVFAGDGTSVESPVLGHSAGAGSGSADRSNTQFGSSFPTVRHHTASGDFSNADDAEGSGDDAAKLKSFSPEKEKLDLGLDLDGVRSRSRTQAPATTRTPAAMVGSPGSPQRPADASLDALGLSPVTGDAGGVSPGPATPAAAVANTTPLQGDVVAAIVGDPSISEANTVLLAAARYGCSSVLLPQSLSGAATVAVPPSLDVEYVGDVLDRATALSQRRALTIAAVFRSRHSCPSNVAATPLPNYSHTPNGLYVFFTAAAEASSAAMVVAAVASDNVFVSESVREGDNIPINACFYDRLQKERR